MMLPIFFSLLPSFIQVPLRRLAGYKIGKHVTISFGVFLKSKKIVIEDYVKISPFVMIYSQDLYIGSHSQVRPFTLIKTRVVKLGQYVQLSGPTAISSEFLKTSSFEVGDHSRIFPFCWLDTGCGITIGRQVGVGGHTLIFTHGVWSDYLMGAPVSYGPVTLEDEVWLPWRVFILPNVVIGSKCIIGANSLVNRSIKSNSLAAGNPAKVIKEEFLQPLPITDKLIRANQILSDFADYMKFKNAAIVKAEDTLKVDTTTISCLPDDDLKKGDVFLSIHNEDEVKIHSLLAAGVNVINHATLRATLVAKNLVTDEFIPFLRRYGIRLYIDVK